MRGRTLGYIVGGALLASSSAYLIARSTLSDVPINLESSQRNISQGNADRYDWGDTIGIFTLLGGAGTIAAGLFLPRRSSEGQREPYRRRFS